MKFKRLSALFLSLAIIGGTAPTVNNIFEKPAIQANAISQFGDVLYEIKQNQLIVYAGSKSLTSVNVPSEINGLPVDALGSYSFANLYKLTSITLPSTLKEIGVCSFYQCDALTSITCPDSLKVIANSAFYDCSYLETVNFNYGLTTIESDAFAYCYKLKDIVLPETVSTIGAQAFQNDINIEKITIANPNCSIADDAGTLPGGAVICAPAGSTAEAYATKYSRKFEAINAPQTTETTTPVVTTSTTTTTPETTSTTSETTTTTTPETTSTTSETTTTTTLDTTSTTFETTTTTTLDTTSTTFETTTTTTPETTSTTSETTTTTTLDTTSTTSETTTTTTPETTSTTSETTTTTTLETTTTTPVQKGMQGDANCDGKIDIADIVSVKCYLLNSVKYELSAIGKVNADVQGSGNGLNLNDVVMIQKYCLKLIDSFEA